ncbi:hypothetical protein NEOLEDRAFT_1133801, partial [Neolentinus lepideus HHB14362 ss-1]
MSVSGSMSEEDQDRPKKRRKTSSASESSNTFSDSYTVTSLPQIAAEEINLEIALRQRLAAAINGRITWALLLQESLSTELESRDATSDYRTSAVDALQAIEVPCDALLSREPFRVTPPQTAEQILRTPPAAESLVDSRRRVTRKGRVSYAPSKPKCLFIRHNADAGPVLAKIQCPDCGRADFPNLQGCFNHCLLKHKKQYGSHDECIRRCVVVVPEEEMEWVLSNGVEINGGNLPSLRRLFQIAVSTAGDVMEQSVHSVKIVSDVPQTTEQKDVESSSSVHLTRTLGLHKDTPSLAPFLGKAPQRRCVNVYNEEEDVDILGGIQPTLQQRRRPHDWHKSYQHRNQARPELDVVLEVPNSVADQLLDNSSRPAQTVPLDAAGTRFHIMARVIIADRSLWIPKERRPSAHPSHSHRWMVSIDSPSYSLHISTFLQRMTVSCVTEAPPSTLLHPITISEPPFIVRSTTDKPFLARIKLEWAGAQNLPMEVEHWVELEEYKHHTPILGDEHVLDVELDRGTELLPFRQIRTNSSLKDTDNTNEARTYWRGSLSKGAGLSNYAIALKTLLHRFPMTHKDVKGRTRPQVPYRLVASPQQLQTLISGRRKAIEWARARALQEAYQNEFANKQGYITLTTRDVFCWLEDEGHFLRPAVVVDQNTQDVLDKSKEAVIPQDVFCYACGFSIGLHEQLLVKSELTRNGTVCTIATGHADRMPIFDIRWLLDKVTALPPPPDRTPTNVKIQSADLVAAADAAMTMSIFRLLASRGLRGGKDTYSKQPFDHTRLPLEQLGAHKNAVEKNLAGSALLAVLLKPLIRQLLGNAIRSMKKLDEIAPVQSQCHGAGSRSRRVRCLTPLHVVQGLGTSAPCGIAESSSLLFGRLGVGFMNSNTDLSALKFELGPEESENWGFSKQIKEEEDIEHATGL